MNMTEKCAGFFRISAKNVLLAVCLMTACLLMGTTIVRAEEQTETEQEVLNILLIGSDHRDDSWNGNSDVMIMATINQKTQQIVLTSFMRDLYADIPGHGVHKLNYAFAVGGAETLKATLEDNYQLTIDNHAIVDFDSMAEIVDIVGGVEIELSDAECKVLNQYLSNMGKEEDYLSGGGIYVLNGYQAVAYMRIRYVGNNDYERTQRQRNVLSEIFAAMQQLDVQEVTSLINEVLPEMDHDISPLQMIRLMSILPDVKNYELVENRIPYDDLYHSQNEMLVPDFEATRARLHEVIGD